MYNDLKATVKQFVNTNDVATIVVGDSNWYKLQGVITNLYGSAVSNTEFWGDIFFDICYDLKINIEFEE